MSQITIYLDESSEMAALEAAARASYWADVDKHKTAWAIFPLTDALNQDLVSDVDREAL